ncbi:MAG: C4-dicarboxylate ABC transporter substrate-binding protein [Beijerinckiaceae bacterium]|nr:C4-dicarboxylate ABC transporter substrate-binding protein [Beijerinckiaceae bacterium]
MAGKKNNIKQRIPRWLRISAVAAFLASSVAVAFFVYQYTTRPKVLSIAVGAVDGDGVRVLNALAARMAATNAPVRLRVVDVGSPMAAADQFAKGSVDLAVVRADIGDLSSARTVVSITNATLLIVAPAGGGVSDVESLRRKTVGVIGLDANQRIIDALTREYDLATHKTVFKPLLPSEVLEAFRQKHIQALIAVLPLTERYMNAIRAMAQGMPKGRLVMVPVESAGAIAEMEKAYESFDVPKGTLRGSPAIPDDDMTTLRVPIYMVANTKLDSSVVNDLAKTVMSARRALIAQNPVLEQIAAPSTDKDAYIPIHPGAQSYFDGDETTLLDKYGDFIWYGSMALGALTSLFAALISFVRSDEEDPDGPALVQLHRLMERVEKADEDELATIENLINAILRKELDKLADGAIDDSSANALNLAVRRLEYLVSQRRVRVREEAMNPGPPPAGTAIADV